METTLLKKLPFFLVFFCFMVFFPDNKCITGKIQHFSILLSITTSFTSQKTFKTNTSHYFELFFEKSSEYLGQKIIKFSKEISIEKRRRKRAIN